MSQVGSLLTDLKDVNSGVLVGFLTLQQRSKERTPNASIDPKSDFWQRRSKYLILSVRKIASFSQLLELNTKLYIVEII